MTTRILLVALGGALGAVLRYGVSGLAYRLFGSGFPWGTLAVNALGCLLIGLLWAAAERSPLSPQMSVFVFVGILGAFTTFSTYALETVQLARDGELIMAGLNLLAANAGGVVLTLVGLFLGRVIGG